MKFVDDNMNGKHFILNTRKLIRTIIKNYFRFATASYTLKWETMEACNDIWHCRQKKLTIYSIITFPISQVIST